MNDGDHHGNRRFVEQLKVTQKALNTALASGPGISAGLTVRAIFPDNYTGRRPPQA